MHVQQENPLIEVGPAHLKIIIERQRVISCTDPPITLQALGGCGILYPVGHCPKGDILLATEIIMLSTYACSTTVSP